MNMVTQENEPIEAVLEDRRLLKERVVELERAMEKFTNLLTGTTTEERGYSFYSWQRICQLIMERPLPSLPAPVWEHTLNEYEKSISSGDTKGASILRALILVQISGPKNQARTDHEHQN